MTVEELVTLLFDMLDVDIKNNPFFIQIRNIIFENLLNGKFISLIMSKKLFANLTNKRLKEMVEVNDDVTLRFSIKLKEEIMFFTIRETNDKLLVEYKIDGQKREVSTIFLQSLNIIRVETIQITKNKGYCLNFDCNIYYYDSCYKSLPYDKELEKDWVFSDYFKIPFKEARKYRTNFSAHAETLSKRLAQYRLRELDALLNSQEYFKFLKPFYLENLEEFINEIFRTDSRESFGTFDEEYSTIYNGEFDYIIASIKEQIGLDGEVVMSKNIYDRILLPLLGIVAGEVSAKGFIIKKTGNFYTLYSLIINNDDVRVFSKDITGEEAKDIFYANPDNGNIRELEEFFGISKGRY